MKQIVYVLLLAGFAYLLLERALIACHGEGSKLAAAVGERDRKGNFSVAMWGRRSPRPRSPSPRRTEKR